MTTHVLVKNLGPRKVRISAKYVSPSARRHDTIGETIVLEPGQEQPYECLYQWMPPDGDARKLLIEEVAE